MTTMHDKAVPKPQPALVVPKGAPRVAAGHLDVVIVDLTRPLSMEYKEYYKAYIYEEGTVSQSDQVISASFFYGTSVADVSTRLEREWRARKLSFDGLGRSENVTEFLLLKLEQFPAVERVVHALSDQFPP